MSGIATISGNSKIQPLVWYVSFNRMGYSIATMIYVVRRNVDA